MAIQCLGSDTALKVVVISDTVKIGDQTIQVKKKKKCVLFADSRRSSEFFYCFYCSFMYMVNVCLDISRLTCVNLHNCLEHYAYNGIDLGNSLYIYQQLRQLKDLIDVRKVLH